MTETSGYASPAKHFQIGAIGVTVQSPLKRILREYGELYVAFEIEQAGAGTVRATVRRTRPSLLHRRRYCVSVNDHLRFEPDRLDEVLPYVEWAVNWDIPRVAPQYLQIHASAMEFRGGAVIFPGESGSGKSTLTAGLLTRGVRYLCDEFALVHADTLHVHPYPRALCVKRPSIPVIESLGLSLHGQRNYRKESKGWVRFLNISALGPNVIGRAAPVRYVIFPRYVVGAKPMLIPLTRAQAAFDLQRTCFNLFRCHRLGIDVIAAMIRQAECFQLVSGEIRRTCDLVRDLLDENTASLARSA